MMHVSKDNLEEQIRGLLESVEAGETVVIERDGIPVAELRPVQAISAAPAGKRPYGLCAGEFRVPDDFDAPLPEDILREFEGG